MPSSSRRSGPPLHTQPHTRLCAELGADLQRIRCARGLSPADVGQTLLMSVRQVEALEGVEIPVFYNQAFFVRGLRKYATLCEVEPARVEAAVAALMTPGRMAPTTIPSSLEGDRAARAASAARPPAGATPPTETETGTDAAVRPAVASNRVAVLLLLAIVCVGAGGAYMLRQRGNANSASSSSPTAAPSQALATTPEPIAVAPALEPAAPVVAPGAPIAPEPAVVPAQEPIQPRAFDVPDAAPERPADVAEATPARSPVDPAPVTAQSPASEGGYGTLRLGRATWLFLRLADNSVTERTLAAGESVSLGARPSYLAIGSPDAVLTLGAQVVDVAPFVRNGQLRMNARDFSQVEPGASSASNAGDAGQPASAASSSTSRGAAGAGASSGSTAPSSSSRPAR